MATLGRKHKGSISKTIKTYGKSPTIKLKNGNKEKIVAQFISEQEVDRITRKFNIIKRDLLSFKEIKILLRACLYIRNFFNLS